MFSSNASQVSAANYIEDVFSTYLYTGNGSTQTITNGIDLATYGGLVWIKDRTAANSNVLFDTARGANKRLISNLTNAQSTETNAVTAFNNNGFSIGANGVLNTSSNNLVSWTFRKQAKFFDVVTWTGNNASSRTISHSLGSTPGFILIKNLTTAEDWVAWHRAALNEWTGALNLSVEFTRSTNNCNAVTSTTFTTNKNSSPDQYVAYLFAHNAGGFGAAGTDNVITCGSYTGNGSASGGFFNLGYEPQWLLIKNSSAVGDWVLIDNMRGMAVEAGTEDSGDALLIPNSSQAEIDRGRVIPAATGFTPRSPLNDSGNDYLFVAIRRGPMKTPTSGTSVFVPVAGTGAYGGVTMTTNFPADLVIDIRRNAVGYRWFFDRLRSTYGTRYIASNDSSAEGSSATQFMKMDSNTTVINNDWGSDPGNTFVSYIFRRAPSFFDEVCYTGTGVASTNISHNLRVVPELLIVKRRSAAANWGTLLSDIPFGSVPSTFLNLNLTGAALSVEAAIADDFGNDVNIIKPTSSVFTVGTATATNASGSTYVAYLFASCPGVSKVGSYTGTGALQTINCGFSAGARFVLIKRTDSTGDWYVWDSARGIVSGNDPYSLLNTDAAEVTNTDYIDTYSAGFEISSTAPAAINANGGSYIFLAIA